MALNILSETIQVGPSSGNEVEVFGTGEVGPGLWGQCIQLESYGRVNSKGSPAGNLTLRLKQAGGGAFSTTIIPLPAGLSLAQYRLDCLFFLKGVSESACAIEVNGVLKLINGTELAVLTGSPVTFNLNNFPNFVMSWQFQTSNVANGLTVDKGYYRQV